jgi:hypothetical protein
VGRVGTFYLPPCSSRIRPSHTEPQHHAKLAKKDVSQYRVTTCMAWYSGAGKCCQSEAYSWLVPPRYSTYETTDKDHVNANSGSMEPLNEAFGQPLITVSHLVAQQRPRSLLAKSTVYCNRHRRRHRVRSWCKVMPLIYVAPTPRVHGPVFSFSLLSVPCIFSLACCFLSLFYLYRT